MHGHTLGSNPSTDRRHPKSTVVCVEGPLLGIVYIGEEKKATSLPDGFIKNSI